ncbi:MAG TPA: DUF4360 domain-containing protein [Polyangium sp.]|nr:DUF4360 domain-containing protein [Polyangium sp.]
MSCFVVIGWSRAASAQTSPDPSKVSITSISYGGTGCPQGTVASSLSTDRKSLTLIFDSYIASSGPGVASTESRKNCQLNINLKIPNTFNYAVSTVDFKGYVQLPAQKTATHRFTTYFQGGTKQAFASVLLAGPASKDYLSRATIATNAMTWMPCGSVVPMTINPQVQLAGTSTHAAQITKDSIDGKVKMILGLQYRPC